ncbi:unnamed protein product [Rotaria magnacalcarata]|uniref:ACB domain-containing protein n=1 Tax=Rotaria magnacalcarata TaxID=392030 RepID=A0A816CUK2_9BILA|nr:unnamed protein product [Rotaria magnacalcarata]CAF1624833.1 unnamed protein product [Rotaria magnacalcarata]CAF2021014.1 unnamed protein product [Rotaria magnacalcarata]CAF2100160.1 unnamed protein product [Rotaria magnacalcarata]CAF2104025.1 unnamed protein product [Rotaria magnacalcarata]
MSQAAFDKAADEVKNLSKKPSDDQLLKLYGLFKQATVGDNTTDKPGMFDLKGKYKWEAWESNKGKAKEAAQSEYVAFVEELKAKQ